MTSPFPSFADCDSSPLTPTRRPPRQRELELRSPTCGSRRARAQPRDRAAGCAGPRRCRSSARRRRSPCRGTRGFRRGLGAALAAVLPCVTSRRTWTRCAARARTSSAIVTGTWKYSQIFSQPCSRMSRRMRRRTAWRRHSSTMSCCRFAASMPFCARGRRSGDEIDHGLLIGIAAPALRAPRTKSESSPLNSCAYTPPPSVVRSMLLATAIRLPARTSARATRDCLSSSNSSANSSRDRRLRDSSQISADD